MTRILPTIAALLATGTAHAQAAPARCVTASEAEALVLFVAPELIRQAGIRCRTALPATALIRRTSGPFLQRYQAETAGAWPRARAALAKIAGPDAAGLLDSSFAQPVIGSLVAPMLVGNLRTEDCASVERAVNLVQPLPPRNVAALVVLFAQADAKAARPQMRLPLCRDAR